METTEKIEVYILTKNGKTICICCADRKGCDRQCEPDRVTRDKFDGWQDVFRRDKYGR